MDIHGIDSVLPAEDIDRVKAFYTEKFGFTAKDQPGGTEVGDGKNVFFVYVAGAKSPGNFTQMGIRVPDVKGTVDELRGKGVTFEEYDMPGLKTENGVATLPDGEQAAWFKDSEGNVVGIVSVV